VRNSRLESLMSLDFHFEQFLSSFSFLVSLFVVVLVLMFVRLVLFLFVILA